MAQQLEQMTLNFNHGHTDTHVVVTINKHVNNIMLLPGEVDAFIAGLQRSKQALLEHTEKSSN